MAGPKLDRKMFTAKFRRDYVACSAVALFFIIVLGEVLLAVSIPLYFARSNLWSLQIARQQLMGDFDQLRNRCNRTKARLQDAVEENNILLWNLNMMAGYLRNNQKTIPMEEVLELEKNLRDMFVFAARLDRDQACNRQLKLNPDPLLIRMAAELNGAQKRGKQPWTR